MTSKISRYMKIDSLLVSVLFAHDSSLVLVAILSKCYNRKMFINMSLFKHFDRTLYYTFVFVTQVFTFYFCELTVDILTFLLSTFCYVNFIPTLCNDFQICGCFNCQIKINGLIHYLQCYITFGIFR